MTDTLRYTVVSLESAAEGWCVYLASRTGAMGITMGNEPIASGFVDAEAAMAVARRVDRAIDAALEERGSA